MIPLSHRPPPPFLLFVLASLTCVTDAAVGLGHTKLDLNACTEYPSFLFLSFFLVPVVFGDLVALADLRVV